MQAIGWLVGIRKTERGGYLSCTRIFSLAMGPETTRRKPEVTLFLSVILICLF